MFEHYCTREIQGCSSSIADKNTEASCRTTGGHPISVSLCLAAPREGSRVCVQLPAGVEVSYALVLAAHGDSVLVQVAGIENGDGFLVSESNHHFVYSAGDAAAEPPRPPLLTLLAPHSSITNQEHKHRDCYYLASESTGLLCRGGGEGNDFLVAELKMEYVIERDRPPGDKLRKDATLHLLRSCFGEWCVKQPVIRRYADGAECVNLASVWENDIVISVGGQKLCWVDLSRGLLFSDDVFDESPSLWYVPLPSDPNFWIPSYRNVCVTGDGGGTIKFVNVFPRCCCGGAGRSYCPASDHAYSVRTWTLRSKTLGSVFRYPDSKERWYNSREHLIPSRVSKYFISKPSSGQPPAGPVAQKEAMQNLMSSRSNNKQQQAMDTMQAASPEAVILAALREIPGLGRDDKLKAYSILAHDDSGRRFRVLMGLPMDLKKDFMLMEIKASEKLVFCALHARQTCN